MDSLNRNHFLNNKKCIYISWERQIILTLLKTFMEILNELSSSHAPNSSKPKYPYHLFSDVNRFKKTLVNESSIQKTFAYWDENVEITEIMI
ncbi:hypothetical protein AYI68_g388 [Smittium mucronatum]|uniref:Uncharacterized protein n=1 Tax=Smittium mucronatum TaxID=133383 RepID=A0A1R0H8J1_9FUNG|nr:hypothetical protein AYI68_g388 [Smittium mucronatum]